MKRGPGVTSAADLLPTRPAARPEPVAPKAASPKDDVVSFAEVLQSETAEQAASESETDVSTEVAVATVIAQPTPVATPAPVSPAPVSPAPVSPAPVWPAATSPEAILAGLTLDQPAPTAALEENAEAPAIEASAQPVPQQAATATIATSPAPAAATAAVQVAAAAPVAAKPAPATASKPTPPAAKSDAITETDDSTDGDTATSVAATPAAPTDAATVAAATPVVAPIAQHPATPQPQAEPLSAPGAERAATASIESATAPADSKSATSPGDAAAKMQGGATRTATGPTPAAETAPEIKVDATLQPATSAGADALPAARTAATVTTQHAAQAQPAPQSAPPATVQVYQRMIERFDGRAQRYEIRLDPAELGRVDVRIEVGADRKVHAVLAAHDSAALTDLMRGQRSLERALSDAGFDVADGGIKFELSNDQNRNSAGDQSASERNASTNVWRGFSALNVAVDAQTADAVRPWRPSSRLDLVA